MIYNNATGSGFFLNTLRYRINKTKQHVQSEVPVDEMNDLSLNDSPLTENERNELLIFFRSCNLRSEKDELINTMKKTIDFRRELLQDEKTQIMQSFPFYFADPNLVCLARNRCLMSPIHVMKFFVIFQILQDFIIMFPKIDSMSLFEKWTRMQSKIDCMNQPKLDASFDDLDIDINQFLGIYNNLRPQRSQFVNVVKSLIIFDKVRTRTSLIHEKKLNTFESKQI